MQAFCDSQVHRANGNEDTASRDLELVRAARAGSGAAFEELQNRYWRRLYGRILSMTKNHEDAEDALQETFLHAYLALDSFEGRSQFASWLTRIAINSGLMVLRGRRRRAEASFESQSQPGEADLTIDVRDTAPNPEQLHDLHQRSYLTMVAIDKLNFNLRGPMTTWIARDGSVKEVAQTLGLSLATVKSRLHRARKQLRCAMGSKRRHSSAGFAPRSKREYAVPDIQNRELPRQSCD